MGNHGHTWMKLVIYFVKFKLLRLIMQASPPSPKKKKNSFIYKEALKNAAVPHNISIRPSLLSFSRALAVGSSYVSLK